MKTIKLYGILGEKFGPEHKLDVNSPAEAVRALFSLFPESQNIIREGQWAVRTKKVGRPLQEVDLDTLDVTIDSIDEVHILPASPGAGIELIIIGGLALFAAVTAVFALTARPPAADDPNERNEEKTSFLFNGPVNVTEQGHPIPLIYGTMKVGSVVVSAGLEASSTSVSDINTPGLPGKFGGGRGSTGGFTNDSFNAAEGGGGKGGGGDRSAKEDPNSLKTNMMARIVDILSQGEIEGPALPGLQWIEFDDVPVENADGTFNHHGITAAWRVGLPNQGHIPGHGFQESTVVIDQDVTVANGAVEHSVIDPDVNRVRVGVQLPRLYQQDTENGDITAPSAANRPRIQIAVQANGGGFTVIHDYTFNGKTNSPYQKDFNVNLPPDGAPWVVRVQRMTPDSSVSTIANDTRWATVTEIIDAKLSYPNKAYVGLEVDAEQFGTSIPKRGFLIKGLKIKIPSNYDPIARTYTGTWDGTFTTAWTDNPAWIYYDLCTNKRYGLGRALENKVDKWGLYTISQYCDGMVDDGMGGQEPRFTCNLAITKRNKAHQVLKALASSFRSMVYWAHSQVYLTQDAPASSVRKLLVPANTVDGKFTYSGSSRADKFSAFIISWNDPAEGFRQNFEVIEDQELIRQIGWKPKEVAAFGCTSRGQANRFGRWLREDQKYNGGLQYGVGPDHADAPPGTIVQVSDPDFIGQRWGGRLKTATTTSLTLDSEIEILSGVTYFISVVLPDGTVEKRTVNNAPGNHSNITFATALSAQPINHAVWAVESDELAARLFRVTRSREKGTDQFTVSASLYDPNKFARVEQGINLPPNEYLGVPTGPLPAPASIDIIEFLKTQGTASIPSMLISWPAAEDPRVNDYEVQIKFDEEGDNFIRLQNGELLNREFIGVSEGTYSVRVRSRDALNNRSPWRLLESETTSGPANVLPEVLNLTSETDNTALQTSLTWDSPNDVRPFRYEILRSDDNVFANAVSQGVTDRTEFTINGTGFYWVRTVFMGETSPAPPVIQITDTQLPNPNWNRVDGRPSTLAELDAAANAILAQAEADIDALEATYGSTANAAASAAAASASESAAAIHETNAQTAQSLAETAQNAAETAEASAQAYSEVAVSATRNEVLPSTFEYADEYFSHSLSGPPDTINDVTESSAHSTISDTDGAAILTISDDFISTKGAIPYIVGDTYRLRVRAKEIAPRTTGTFQIQFRRVDSNYDHIAASGSVSVTPVSTIGAFETTHVATQALYDAGARYLRGVARPNNASGDGQYHTYFLEIRNVSQEANSEAAAAAAATSETNAAASETAAGSSASAAQISATNASTSEANAATSETNASVSETNASGSAAAAATSETNAATSETNAGNSASAAATSASTAQTEATNASTSASAAATSAVEASTTVMLSLPSRADNAAYFTNNLTGTPETRLDATEGVVNDPTYGDYIPVGGVAVNDSLRQKGWVEHNPDKIWEITYRLFVSNNGAAGDIHSRVGMYSYDETGASVQANIQPSSLDSLNSIADGVFTKTYRIGGSSTTGNDTTLDSAAVWWRPHIRQNALGNADGQLGLISISIQDITARIDAETEASAAAASASSASASESAAGASATAAQTSETNAATSASNASTSAGQASTSETNAAGSAAAAASSETVAANAAIDATTAVRITIPSTFDQGGAYFTDQRGMPPSTARNADGNTNITTMTDATEGPGLNLFGGGAYLFTKEPLPYVVDNTYRVTVRLRENVTPTNDNIRASFTRLGADYTFISQNLLNPILLTLGVTDEQVFEYTATQASYDIGARWLRGGTGHNLLGSGSNDGEWDIFILKFENITESYNAEQSANAAFTSETNAAASATSAGSFATAAQNSELSAATSASNASISESSAAVSASDASTSAAAAQTSMLLAARIQSNSINLNSTFADYSVAGGLPSEWDNWAGGASGTHELGLISANAYRLVGLLGSNRGIWKNMQDSIQPNSWHVIEADVVLNAGTFNGAGVLVTWRTAGDAGSDTTDTISFKNDLDETNTAPGDGVVGRRYRFTKLVQAHSATEGFYIYATTHWTSHPGGVNVDANDITWHKCSLRPASQMEIDAGRVIDIEADVAINAGAIASVEGYMASYYSMQVGAGGELAQIALRSAVDGSVSFSDIKLSADKLIYEADGQVIWYSDADGLTMNKAIRWVAPAVNPTTMYVLGLGFGSSNNLMEWFGPYATDVNSCAISNGVRAKTTDGKTYLNGTQEGGTAIVASDSTTTTVAEVTSIGANGQTTEATGGYGGGGNRSYWNNTDPGAGTFPNIGNATVSIWRKEGSAAYQNVWSVTISGSLTRTSEYDFEQQQYFVVEVYSLGTSHTHSQQSNAAETYDWKTEVTAITGRPSWVSGHGTSIAIFEPPA